MCVACCVGYVDDAHAVHTLLCCFAQEALDPEVMLPLLYELRAGMRDFGQLTESAIRIQVKPAA